MPASGAPSWPTTDLAASELSEASWPGSADRDAVWVSDPASAAVLRIDPRRNRVVGREFAAGQAMVAADGRVWATSGTSLVPVGDPARREVPLVDIPDPEGGLDTISDLAAGPATLWVAAPTGLYRVDLRRLR